MNILIYGAGALGQALGCMLAAAGQQVDFIMRERFIRQIAQSSLRVTGILGEFAAPIGNCTFCQHIDQAVKHYDFAVITTKTYDTDQAIGDLATLGDRAPVIVSMQNGCGNVERIENTFGPDKTLGARVITGFEIVQPGRIAITVSADSIHVGGSRRGVIPDAARLLADLVSGAGHPALAVPDIHQSLFAKLLYNCALNPLGAILGVHYGALVERSETRRLMDQIIEETFAVIKAMGGTTPWSDAEGYKEVFYHTLVPATYNHRPSMLQDLENGKPTEVEALVGYVGRQGKIVKLPTPGCDVLADLVRFKEQQGRSLPR